MHVRAEEIHEGGLHLAEAIDRKLLEEALAPCIGIRFVAASSLEAKFQRIAGVIWVSACFEVEVAVPCRRCLKEVQQKFPVEFSVRMLQEGARSPGTHSQRTHRSKRERDFEQEAGGSFEMDQVDVETFDGRTIDMDPIVREHVLLAVPEMVLCKDSCKGLCPHCGQDLNETQCGHEANFAGAPRLDALANVKLKG